MFLVSQVSMKFGISPSS